MPPQGETQCTPLKWFNLIRQAWPKALQGAVDYRIESTVADRLQWTATHIVEPPISENTSTKTVDPTTFPHHLPSDYADPIKPESL